MNYILYFAQNDDQESLPEVVFIFFFWLVT